jgi:membrane associated rhomboid family serine protease
LTEEHPQTTSGTSIPRPDQSIRVTGRFTAADGLRGWWQGRSRRSPCYGIGSIARTGSTLELRGWQRTWLGAPTEVDLLLAIGSVRNVARAGALIRFEGKLGRRWRVVEFTVDNEAAAATFTSALPETRTATFETVWNDEQDYRRHMESLAGHAWVTPLLLALNVAAYIALAIVSESVNPDPLELVRWGANSGLLTTQGDWWRLSASTFLHLNLLHIYFNGWALWNAGRLTERLYGSWTYLAIYLVTGALASLASTVWNPALMSVGASGAIFGVLGALLACTFRGSGVPKAFVRAHRWSTLLFVAFNLVVGALSPAIDNAAHVGGLLSGLALGLVLHPSLTGEASSRIPPARLASAGVLVMIALTVGVFCIRAPRPDPEGPAAWIRQGGWYQSEESRRVRRENSLAVQLQAGQISPADYEDGIRRDVLPFYEEAPKRLAVSTRKSRDGGPGVATLTRDYAIARQDWLRASLAAIDHSTPEANANTRTLKRRLDATQARITLASLHEQYNGRPQGLRWAMIRQWRSLRTARSFVCATSPPTWHHVASSTDSPGDGPALRRAAGCDAQRRFLLGDYHTLSARLGTTLAQLDDLPDGSATFTGIVDGLDDLFQYGGIAPDEVLLRLSDWRRAVPHSVYPDLLEAAFFHDWAWSVRGSGFAQSVNAAQWEIFRARTDLAFVALEHVAPRTVDQPLWYQLSINVALDRSSTTNEIRAVYDAGAARNPSYHALDAAMLRVLLPRWQGTSQEVVEFIDGVSGPRSDATYARLVWTYARLEQDQSNIFDEDLLSWPRVQVGFSELLRQYPRSDYLRNTYAHLACLKGDVATYRLLRADAGWRVSSTAWTEETTPATCDQRLEDSAASTASPSVVRLGGHVDTRGNVVSDAEADAIRRQVTLALEAAEPMRQALSRYMQEHGRLPRDDELRADPKFKSVSLMGATVSLGPGASINMRLTGGPLDGHQFSWTPNRMNGALQWICAQETIPPEYLGPPCL